MALRACCLKVYLLNHVYFSKVKQKLTFVVSIALHHCRNLPRKALILRDAQLTFLTNWLSVDQETINAINQPAIYDMGEQQTDCMLEQYYVNACMGMHQVLFLNFRQTERHHNSRIS